MNVRTRNAPSPTGYAHIGTIYQSLIDKAYAQKNNGKFILRIEDTDTNRYVEGSVDAVFEALDWVQLIPDESLKHKGDYGPYVQSERLEIYKEKAEELLKNGHAYYCFCTPERLEEVRKDQQKQNKPPMYDGKCRGIDIEEARKRIADGEKYVIRLKVPENEKIIVQDLIRGNIEFDSKTIDDQVLLKSDGYPTYHLAVVVDDHLMEISHVVRGPEWLTSFPKHKLIYDYFGWKMPIFVHTPLITNMDGSKLSKRHGHSSVDWFRRKGYLPEAVINFISLLGWSHPQEKEIFSFDEYVSVFELKDLSAVSPKFDIQKLNWMNGQYIQNLSNEEILGRIKAWLKYCIENKYKGSTAFETSLSLEDYKKLFQFLETLPPEKQLKFAEVNKQRIKIFEDLLPLNKFFIETIDINKELLYSSKSANDVKLHLEWVKAKFDEVKKWNLENLKMVENEIASQSEVLGWKVGEVFYPIRIAICRSKISPPLIESMWIIGKEETISRLNEAINI